jgi:hypothetical protein
MGAVVRETRNLIGGELRPAASGETMDLVDPSTGKVFASAPRSGAADVDAACHAAADAFPRWRDATPSERSLALLRIADAIEARGEELIRLECDNTGKPFQLTLDEELPPAVDQIRFFAGAARVLEGRSAVDQSMLTGEPVPVEVGPGDQVAVGVPGLRAEDLLDPFLLLGDPAFQLGPWDTLHPADPDRGGVTGDDPVDQAHGVGHPYITRPEP